MMTIMALHLFITFNEVNKFDYWSYVFCFVWGMEYSGSSTLIYCILGFEFPSKLIPFGIYKFFEGITIFILQIVLVPVMRVDDFTSPLIPSWDNDILSVEFQKYKLHNFSMCIAWLGILSVILMFWFPFEINNQL